MKNKVAVRTVIGLTILGGIAAGMSGVQAASTSANLSLTASVANNCTIATSAVAFGSYDPVVAHAAADLDGAGQVTIACTKGAAATIGLDLGSNAAVTTRRLSDGVSSFLTYELYTDVARADVWGDAAPDLFTPAVAPSKVARSFSVYGRIPSNQDVPAGAYTDTVVATVNF